MIEEQITKNPSRAKRLFKGLIATAKYLFIAVLVFSLIAGLLLQAPWKVLTLIAIILATLTVIPRPARKWIWMTFGLTIIALIIWVFLPDNDSSDWKPFTFKDKIAAFEATRAIPDEDNAATIYNQLLANYDEQAFGPNFRDEDPDDLTMEEPWLSRDHPKIAQWLQEHQNTIATLIQASRKNKCSLPTYFDTVGLSKHTDMIPYKHWAYLLVRGANNDLGHGRIDQAMTKETAVLKIGDHFTQQPTFIDVLVGHAIEQMAFGMFKTFAVAPYATEQHLDVLYNALEDVECDWQFSYRRTIDHEKLFLKNSMVASFYEINSKYKTRLTRDPTAAFRAQFMEMGLAYPDEDFDIIQTYWQKKLLKAGTIVAWFVMPPTPQEAGKIVNDVYQRYYAMTKPNFDWEKGPEELSFTSIRLNFRTLIKMLAFLSEPAWYKIHDHYLRIIAMNRATRIMIALRRHKNKHGNWPENLDNLKSFAAEEIFVDPVNTGQFVYKLTDDGFTLYSKGKNNVDENGERNVSFGKSLGWPKTQEDDILIWPRKTQKPKEVTI